MEPEAILTIVRDITVTGLLSLGIWALATGRIVSRFHYDEMKSHYENRIARLRAGKSQYPFPDE